MEVQEGVVHAMDGIIQQLMVAMSIGQTIGQLPILSSVGDDWPTIQDMIPAYVEPFSRLSPYPMRGHQLLEFQHVLSQCA